MFSFSSQPGTDPASVRATGCCLSRKAYTHQLQQQLEKLSKELVALRFQNVVLQKSIIRRDEKNKLRLEKLKKAENTQQ